MDEPEDGVFGPSLKVISDLLDHIDTCSECKKDEEGGVYMCKRAAAMNVMAKRVAKVMVPFIQSKNN